MKKYEFDAVIIEGPRGGAFVEFPFDVKKEFGTGGRVNVIASFDGLSYRGSIVPMGGGKHILGILKEIRGKINKNIGDLVNVVIEQDLSERVVIIPDELREAFDNNPDAKEAFDRLSYSHRREYTNYIAEGKASETRLRRASKTVDKLIAP